MKRWIWITMGIALLCLIGFGAVQFRYAGRTVQASADVNPNKTKDTVAPAAKTKGAPLPVVRVETVSARELIKTADLTGAVTPTRIARLASPGEGPVAACRGAGCLVREGDRVAQGQILIQISRNQSAQAQLAAAAQALKEQETELQRIMQLVQGGAIPGAQLDAARSKYENARAQLAKAEESAGDYLIEAPWSGVVSKVFVTEGDYVAPRAPLIEIFDPASLVVRFAVSESQCTDIQGGMPVRVGLDAYPGKTFQATISRVYPQLDQRTRTRTAEATLAEPVDLLPGMFARVRVVLAQIPDALTVPAHSLAASSDGGYGVYIVQDGRAVRREVTTGLEIDGRVHVLSGLQAGDQVIVAGHEKLKNGTAVKTEPGQSGDSSPMKGSGGARS